MGGGGGGANSVSGLRNAEIRSAPSVAYAIMAESRGRVPKYETWSVRLNLTLEMRPRKSIFGLS